MEAYHITIEELNKRFPEDTPKAFVSNAHMIYSSPATLAFNSPGAEGFGVKRAGLAIPDSIMILVSPGCCGRNTTGLGNALEYRGRMFYLQMEEADIVTGRHLKRIPKAVEEILEVCEKKPSVVMICITCVDALLGTDMERVCEKAQERVGIPVRPCYMYALTREGRKPPMVHVRQSLYSLLAPMKKRGTSVNLLGYFAPLTDDCEIYELLRGIGVKQIREISRCENYEEYLQMAEANFNLVLHPEAREAAADLEKRLQIPSIELKRLYQLDKIENQYKAFASALGVEVPDLPMKEKAWEKVREFQDLHPGATFAIGEFQNGDPFEMAVALTRYGFRVKEIYGTPGGENSPFIERLAELSPETQVYANLDPSMIAFRPSGGVDYVIGKDAAYYNPGVKAVHWWSDVQPFGYAGVYHLFSELLDR